ncbi:nuclease [Azospirillum cavernae]|uniref:Nuclease n=1 Tax=Azospirillum cavernae TaxID=2320860 RepID=A0A418W3H3_9PROT|nr:nuclease [Azospirillum cavernae]
MSTYQLHIFISHSWSYSGHYEKLAEWIFETNWSFGQASVNFLDFSVPKSDPIYNAPTDRALKDAIYAKIARSHVVMIPTGMYANYSKWIQKEIDGSNAYNKPILGVDPWSQIRTASVVQRAARLTVGWNSKSVAQGIWDLYRGI